MSAWLVEAEHLDLILTMAVRAEYVIQNEKILTALGQKLWDENHKSVQYRHPDAAEYKGAPPTYRYCRFPYPFSRVDANMAIKSLAYQSCEHPSYEGSVADLWLTKLFETVESLYDADDKAEDDRGTSNGWMIYVGMDWRGEKLYDYRSLMLNEESR